MTLPPDAPHLSRLDGALRPAPPPPKPTRPQRLLEYLLFVMAAAMLSVAAVALFAALSPAHREVPNLVSAGVADDRVNVLFVVSSTKNSRDITEAMMLLSVKPSRRDIALLSIPADLWVRLGNYGVRRLGSALAVGRSSGYPGRGPGLVARTVEEILDQPVHAYVRVEPADVRRMIDAAGGIDVRVQRGVYDAATRTGFRRGLHHFDGEQAVRYAFSGRIARPYNDRFAREERQREVIAALLAESPPLGLLTSAAGSTATNLSPQQVAWLRTFMGQTPHTVSLAPYVDVFHVTSATDKGEALRPRVGNFAQLQQIAANVF